MPTDPTQQTPTLPQLPYDDSVQTNLNGLLKQTNPLMTQARTQGAQYANKRGLLNSSMGAQAGQEAMLKVALPIASQEAQQAYGKNIQTMQTDTQKELQDKQSQTQMDIAGMNVASNDREKAMQSVVQANATYASMFNSIMTNEDMPWYTRNDLMSSIARSRDASLNLVEQMYNVDLQWV